MDEPSEWNPEDASRLVAAATGDRAAWSQLVERYHPRLRRMVALRMDHRLQARVDPSDILQEAYVDAAGQLSDYLRNPVLPFYLWLRMVTGGRLGKVHRFHLGTQMRTAVKEVPLHGQTCPEVSSHSLAELILARDDPPDAGLQHQDRKELVRSALDALSPAEREVICLRHFEKMGLVELAQVLNVTKAAAGKRYLRAVARLKVLLKELPGGWDSLGT